MNNSGITRGLPKTPFSFPSTVNQLQSRYILSYQSCHSLPFLSSKRSVSVLVLVIPSLKLGGRTWNNYFETQEEKLVSQLPTIDFHASWATLLSASVSVYRTLFFLTSSPLLILNCRPPPCVGIHGVHGTAPVQQFGKREGQRHKSHIRDLWIEHGFSWAWF